MVYIETAKGYIARNCMERLIIIALEGKMEKKDNMPVTKLSEAVMDLLIEIPMFDSIKSDELQIISRHMKFMDFKKGEIIFKEGDRGDYVCFVAAGSLDVSKINEHGESVVISSLGRGRSIGEMAVIDAFTRSATVRARVDTTLVILRKEDFELIVDGYPVIGVKILKGISRLLSMNLRKTSSRLADYMLPFS
jgi:CRP/FNR family transcriptional regulator, cyclic AMP receptor protein